VARDLRQQCNRVISVAGNVDEKHPEGPYASFTIRTEESGQSNLLVYIMINKFESSHQLALA
jgi:hypothetical protein